MGFVSEKQTYYIVDRLKDILNWYETEEIVRSLSI